jgi:hypothetical protein
MSKRKWKVYTTDELRDRFQTKPGSSVAANDDHKVVVPNLKRRNSAPPGMIHFPPGTFSAGNTPSYLPSSPVPAHHQQHELVTHANRSSPTNKSHPYPSHSSHPSLPSRLEKRRASLPFIPSSSLASTAGPPHASVPGPPSIEAYLSHLQQIPLAHHDDEDDQPPLSPSHTLPSFQSLLQTIREDADEEDSEIREIEERANGSPIMQTSKTLPINYKEMAHTKSPQLPHHQIHEQHPYYTQPPSNPNHFPFPSSLQAPAQEPPSPSSKFYKNNLSRSNENLPSLSRMSISDIIG